MIKLPKPTPPPAITNTYLLLVANAYALTMVFLALWQLITFQDFITYIAGYFGGGVTMTTTLAAVLLVTLEVFAVPFLLRLHLSPLARACSASSALLVPVLWAVVTLATQPLFSVYVPADILFIVWGATTFWVLGGRKALRLK